MPITRRSILLSQNHTHRIIKTEDSATMPRRRVANIERQLDAVQKLASLQQNSTYSNYTNSNHMEPIRDYVKRAAKILDTLGPEYDESVTLKMVRGLADSTVKQVVAMIMYDKEWEFEEVEKILNASTRKDIFAEDDQLTRALEGRLITY
ncbi:hypothetical protein TWF281_004202 [Arthrobotrys megalospora]